MSKMAREEYLKELTDKDSFWQNLPISADKFVEYCNERKLKINKEYLEYLEAQHVIMPIMRIREYYISDISDIGELDKNGCIIDPYKENFVSWENLENIHTYYHPYQIVFLNKILFCWNYSKDISVVKSKLSKQDEFIQLLLLIQNKYLPIITGYTVEHPFLNLDWNEFEKDIIPKDIIKNLGLEIEEIKNFREQVGITGLHIDPLRGWYDLVKYIKYKKRLGLNGDALLAQDYYLICDMLKLLLYDVTGEEQLDCGSLSDAMKGRGKEKIYGKKLNYKDRDILSRILYDYGLNPKPRVILIVEGDTEEITFPMVFNAMNFPIHRYGIEIKNIRGIDREGIREMVVQDIKPDIYNKHIYPFRTKVFIIVDNEGHKDNFIPKLIRNSDIQIGYVVNDVLRLIKNKIDIKDDDNISEFLKKGLKISAWKQNFEYDNFNNVELARELNKYCGISNITDNDILDLKDRKINLKDFVLTKTNRFDKVGFGKHLAEIIVKEIEENIDNNRSIIEKLNDVIMFTLNE